MAVKVKISVKYSCGCSFNCKQAAEAVEHVKQTQHALTVLGMLRPDFSKEEE